MKSLMLVTAVALFPSFALAAGTHEGGHDYAAGAPARDVTVSRKKAFMLQPMVGY